MMRLMTPFALHKQPVIGFIATCNPDRAKTFYRDLLGLPMVAEELPFALVFDACGTMLRVTIVKEFTPQPYTVLGWRVSSIEDAAAALHRSGVEFERYPGMKQDDLGIWASPSGAKIAWFKDTDGNTLSISQH